MSAVALAALVFALPPPRERGCATYGCSTTRGFLADVSLPFNFTPTRLWMDPTLRGPVSCSGDVGALGLCVSGDGETAAFNHSGIAWQAGNGATSAPQDHVFRAWPPVMAGTGMNAIAASLEGPLGSRFVAVRSRSQGSLEFGAAVSVGSSGLGVYLMAKQPFGDDGLLLAFGDRSSPTVFGFNVELGMCWSALLMCANTSSKGVTGTSAAPCVSIDQPGVLHSLGPPASLPQGGHAFVTAALRAEEEPHRTFVVRIDIGDMADRLPAIPLGAVVDASPLLSGGWGDPRAPYGQATPAAPNPLLQSHAQRKPS